MEEWTEIRRRVLSEGVSKRQILRETGMHWETLERILAHPAPPGYQMNEPRPKPKTGPFEDRIREILEADKEVPKKQRHTAKRIFDRLVEEGYTGGETAIKNAVRKLRREGGEVFVPVTHEPGEAQVDFGFALAKVDGRLRKVAFFVMALPYSDALFVQVFERECTETFQEGHVRAFEFFGGVPRRISYDNSRVMVSKILQGRDRKLTRGFLQLESHYLFDHHFCRVRRANEKGVVEGTVGFVRRNFMVPVPQVRDLEELNAHLLERCRGDLERRLRGQKASKQALLEEEREKFLPPPPAPMDACRRWSTFANSLSLVRFESNDYSVPVRCAHHTVVVKGFVDRVEIARLGETVAVHRRIWEKECVSFDPIHYLALLERKPGALDHARPLEQWDLPEPLILLRRRLESEYPDGHGTREYIRVLRLLEKHEMADLVRAADKALRIGALSRDAVAQFLLPPGEVVVETFRLEGREHLKGVHVAPPDLGGYGSLLDAGGGS